MFGYTLRMTFDIPIFEFSAYSRFFIKGMVYGKGKRSPASGEWGGFSELVGGRHIPGGLNFNFIVLAEIWKNFPLSGKKIHYIFLYKMKYFKSEETKV